MQSTRVEWKQPVEENQAVHFSKGSIRMSMHLLQLIVFFLLLAANAKSYAHSSSFFTPDLLDPEISQAYEKAAVQNILAAVNAKVFFGYWSVCADGKGFGYGNTYPSLDGHQMTDALLWLGEVEVVKANWDYVRSFQREDGSLPIAILPELANKQIGEGEHLATVSANGGLYVHWVPGNPLQVLADPTYIQNADDIFRATLHKKWLSNQLPSINLAAEHLASLTDARGTVKGGGYYIEMPARLESDGVAQCHAVDAFRRVAALNRVLGDSIKAKRYDELAERIRQNFVTRFWLSEKKRFAEYYHPQHGYISSHGLTDVDWAAIALDVASVEQQAILWPQLKDEKRFYYGGMPTGIATTPETYEDWEFTHPRRHDVAAMGRVWHLEAQARARMGDAEGLLAGIRIVCEEGRKNGYYWRERYQPDSKGGAISAGPNTYCEYPANLIRIIQRFLLGAEFGLDGSLLLAPTATEEFWEKGFGQTLHWRDRILTYQMHCNQITGTYMGDSPQSLGVRFAVANPDVKAQALVNSVAISTTHEGGFVFVTLPSASHGKPCWFEIEMLPSE